MNIWRKINQLTYLSSLTLSRRPYVYGGRLSNVTESTNLKKAHAMKNLIFALPLLFACQADLKVKTKQVAVNCDKNPLHPNCQEHMMAPATEGEDQNLPKTLKAIELVNEAVDGYVNLLERASTLPAYTYTPPYPNLVVTYSGWQQKPTACDKDTAYDSSEMPGISTMPELDGEYYICVKVEDPKKKRKLYGRSPTTILDTSLPEIKAIPQMGLSKVSDIKAEATDTTSLRFAWSKVSGPGAVTFGAVDKPTAKVSCEKPGSYKIQVKVTDIAGNESTRIVDVIWDPIPPTIAEFAGAGVAVDGFINGSEKADTGPMFALVAKNHATIRYSKVDKGDKTPACGKEKKYDQSKPPLTNVLTEDGSYVLCAKLTNKAGLTVYAGSKPVIRDTVAPTGTLENGTVLSDGKLSTSEHATDGSLVTFTSSETGMTPVYAISDITLSCDKGSYEATALANHATLNTAGTYKVCAKFYDAAGNIGFAESSNFVADYTAPTVVSVTTNKTDSTYSAGESIDILVTFTEAVTVTGTPQLSLETGATDAVINYVSGSDSAILTFTYVVSNGENTGDLDYVSNSALALNGGTIADLSANTADLTLANPSASNSAEVSELG